MKMIAASVPDRVMKRVRASGRGSVFTPSDFLGVAARPAVDQALSRLVKGGQLRRLARGLYDFPKLHPKLGPLSPAPDNVAQALARETGSQVQIAGARAANALGLSTQVPLRAPPDRWPVASRRAREARRRSSPRLAQASDRAGQPRRHSCSGSSPCRSRAGADVAQVAERWLSANDKKTLASTAVQAPAWMRPTLVSIANTALADIDG